MSRVAICIKPYRIAPDLYFEEHRGYQYFPVSSNSRSRTHEPSFTVTMGEGKRSCIIGKTMFDNHFRKFVS